MIEKAEELLSFLKEGRIEEGEALALELIQSSLHLFMEKLTVETATDLAGIVLIYAELCSNEKKPWKAVLQMDRVEGALRFLSDFMTDRNMAALTHYRFASQYAYAGFYPEAAKLYEKCIRICSDFELAEDAVYYALINLHRSEKLVSKESKELFVKILGKERFDLVSAEAKGDFDSEFLRDPIEREEAFLSVRYEVEALVEAELNLSRDTSVPYCISYWETKKRILLKKFDITWKTPEEMNPNVRFQ